MPRRLLRVFWRAYRLWDRNDCVDLSAAFAYHSLQSLFPILLIVVSIASRILGRDDGLTERILESASTILPDSAEPFVRLSLDKLYRQGTGAGIVGLVFLLLTASNAYLTLQRGADRLWGLRTSAPQLVSWQVSVAHFLRVRIEAFALVFFVAVFMVLDQLTTSIRMLDPSSWRAAMAEWVPGSLLLFFPVSDALDRLISAVISCLLAYALLRLLPSRRVPMGPLIPGALLIGLSLTLLNVALGRSLVSLGSRFQAYGVIGGVLVLTLWVWLVGVILYYGLALSVVISGRATGGPSTPHGEGHRLNQGAG
ncbi:YihY/virulence factor BrkB family protein [Cyanobium sp. ATX 6F1]|nr:YihY/virulence factor BrkB family protein [Cyanobium sp. ATX 6F1]